MTRSKMIRPELKSLSPFHFIFVHPGNLLFRIGVCRHGLLEASLRKHSRASH